MSSIERTEDRNLSVIGRLLEELSWVGSTIRNYREGGRGYENVLTAEALQALDFLPRKHFCGAVLSAAHGASATRQLLVSEIEEANFALLPGNRYLIPSSTSHSEGLPVQPDGILESPSTFGILESKRIRSSSFQSEQLSREYVLALRDAGARQPLLLLVLGQEPPINVKKQGRMTIPDAVNLHLEKILGAAENHSIELAKSTGTINDVVCWITWGEIASVIET